MSEHVLQNVIGPPSTATFTPQHVEGTPFQCTVSGVITRLGWYRPQTGAGVGPNGLALWDTSFGGGILARVTTPGDDGTVGWQWSDLETPVQIYAGRTYFAAMSIPAGNVWARLGGSPAQPTPTDHLTQVPTRRVYNSSGDVNSYPSTTGNDFLNWVSAEWDTLSVGFPETPVTVAEIDNLLTAWFSENDNTHQTDVPWLTKLAAGNAQAAAESAQTAATGAQASADANGTALSSVSTQLAGVGTDVATLLNRLSDALATKLNEMSDGLAALLNDAASVLGGGWPTFVNQMTRATGGSGFGGPDPLAGWTRQDTLEFTDEAIWTQEADLYRVNLDNTGSLAPADPILGVNVTYRLGWWSVLNGGFFRDRRYIDGPQADLLSPTGRMPGLVIFLNHGGHGTIEAWTKDPTA